MRQGLLLQPATTLDPLIFSVPLHGWETLNVRRSRNKSILMYKILNGHTAPNLKDLFRKKNVSQNTYSLRNSDTDLTVTKPKTEFLRPKP